MKTAMPLPVRFLNMVGRSVNGIGFQPVNLSLDKLLQIASENTGLTDFGENDFRQPLALLLDGLEREANLSLLGRIVAKSDLVRTLEKTTPESRGATALTLRSSASTDLYSWSDRPALARQFSMIC